MCWHKVACTLAASAGLSMNSAAWRALSLRAHASDLGGRAERGSSAALGRLRHPGTWLANLSGPRCSACQCHGGARRGMTEHMPVAAAQGPAAGAAAAPGGARPLGPFTGLLAGQSPVDSQHNGAAADRGEASGQVAPGARARAGAGGSRHSVAHGRQRAEPAAEGPHSGRPTNAAPRWLGRGSSSRSTPS